MFTVGVNSLPKADSKKISMIKGWVGSLLKLDKLTTIFVTQLECQEPGCPPIETVIALMKPKEKTEQKKIHKCINDINENDIIRIFKQ